MTDLVERFSTESLLRPRDGVRVMRPRLRSVDVHWHDYYELGVVVSGVARHVVNGERSLVRPGSAFLLSPADLHSFEAVGEAPLDCYNTVIAPVVMERELAALDPAGVHPFPWRADDLVGLVDDVAQLERELEGPRWGSDRLAEALVTRLVVGLARGCLGDRPGGVTAATVRGDDGLRSAVLHVDRHFREPLTLADVASRAHLSPNYFSERFRDYTGTSFQQYLQERRLRFARSLLASTSLSVTEVCHAAGFGSLSHFGRAYRRRYGAPPSRRSHESPSAVVDLGHVTM